MTATQEEIAAAWSAWQSRHGGKLGPGPAFVEAINAALALRLPTIESLQRENEELRKDKDHIAAEKAGIAKNAHSNVDYWKSQAEAAEAEVKRLTAPVTIDCRCTKIAQDETCHVGYPSLLCETCDGKGVLPYVELDGPELWEIVFGVNDDVAGEITDAQYDQIAKAINDVFISPLRARTALASTGGEHHAE